MLNQLEWKVVGLALLACYFLPGVLVATLVAAGVADVIAPAVGQAVTGLLAFVSFLVPPVAGGYFAARFARRAPKLHIVVVGVLGALLSLLAFRASPRAMVAYVFASIALAAFGGYIRLGSAGKT